MPHFGLHLNSLAYPDTPPELLFHRAADIARTAEDAGFHSIWVLDHLIQGGHAGKPHEPMLDSYTFLGALASETRRAQLGTLVTAVTFRNPAHLAKIVTTLDVVSAGRAVLGIGAAWFEPEHQAYGFPFPPIRERMDRLEETVRVCRAMFREQAATFEGRHFQVRHALNVPPPVQPGGPPILIGGTGERRTLRLVARYADISNFPKHTASEQIPKKLSVLRRYCEEIGRDPSEIMKTRKQTLVIAPSKREARRKGARQRELWGESKKRYRDMVIEGDPDQIVDQVAANLAAGFDGIIFNVTEDWDLDSVRLAGKALSNAFP